MLSKRQILSLLEEAIVAIRSSGDNATTVDHESEMYSLADRLDAATSQLASTGFIRRKAS
jgi:hypothetical protein